MVLMLPDQKFMNNFNGLLYGEPPTTSPMLTSYIWQGEPTLLRKLIQQMPSMLLPDADAMFPIAIDSGTTASITHVKEDFQEGIQPSPFHHMQGLSKSIDILVKGTVKWIIDLDNGK